MEKRNAQACVTATMPEKLSWLKAVLRDDKLSAPAKNIATALFMCHSQTTGRCNPSRKHLAEAVGGMCEQNVSPHISALKAGGWISTTRTRGVSYYVLHVERGAAEKPAEMSADHDMSEVSGQSRCLRSQTADVCEVRHQESAKSDMEPSTLTVQSEPSFLPAPPAVAAGSGTGKDEASGRIEPKPMRSRFSEMSADWQPDEACRTIAAEAGVRASDLAAVVAAFSLHHRGKGTRSPDWAALWEMWCRKAVEIRTDREARGTAIMPDSATSRTARSRFQIPVPRLPAPAEAA
jgi:hypothetical protein